MDCFYFGSNTNNASTAIHVQFHVGLCFISLGYIPRNGSVRCYGNFVLNYLRNYYFPKRLCHFTFPPAMYEGTDFFLSTRYYLTFGHSHHSRYEVVSPYSFLKKFYCSVIDLWCCINFCYKVTQLHIFFFIFFHYGFHRILNIVPCAVQKTLLFIYPIYL